MALPSLEESRAPRRSQDCKFISLVNSSPPRPLSRHLVIGYVYWQAQELTWRHSEDGTIDHNNAAGRASGAHKLGPKANQGAINAGLRALDRSGKPCRKWARGGFTLKSFTGVIWEIPRWTAPPRKALESGTEDSAEASAEGSSSKENKENGAEPNSTVNSNHGADVEMQSAPSASAPSPAPLAIAAAS